MRLEVRTQLSCRRYNGEGHLLEGGVSSFRISHALARVEDRLLLSSILSDEDTADRSRGYGNIKREFINGFGFGKYGRSRKILLELFELLLALLVPNEMFVPSQQLVEGKAFIHRSGNEAIQGRDSSRESLDFSAGLWTGEVEYGGDLFRICHNSSLGDDVSQKLS